MVGSAIHDDWQKLAVGELKVSPDTLLWQTPEGIVVKPLYTRCDLDGVEHLDTSPGTKPFLRGPRATMYAGRPKCDDVTAGDQILQARVRVVLPIAEIPSPKHPERHWFEVLAIVVALAATMSASGCIPARASQRLSTRSPLQRETHGIIEAFFALFERNMSRWSTSPAR